MVYKKNKIEQVRKRDGRIVDFDQSKITQAIFKALKAVDLEDEKKAEKISDIAMETLNKKFHPRSIPAIEEIQDVVEESLIKDKQIKAAKAYILYREQHARLRDLQQFIDSDNLIEGYLKNTDWEVKENANMGYSLQGLNNHVASAVSKHYWTGKIYPQEIRDANENGDLHIHDLQTLAPYCCGWDLEDLMLKGFGGVWGKLQCSPPKHLRSALGQAVNFFYTLQGEAAGAQAFSSFDTLLAPLIRYDNLDYKQVKQSLQEFIFNTNVPTRVGFQTPFTNITLDLNVPSTYKDKPVILGGQPQKETYGEFQAEMDMLNIALAEVMTEGDSAGRVFTFPIPTYNITKDFDWNSPIVDKIMEMTAKFGIPYFANFINSDMDPSDVRSMCCRLRLDNRVLRKRGGGLFGANPLTGSIGVVTINMPRIGYLAKTEKDFYERLVKFMDIAKNSLEIKREALEKFTSEGLYPYSRFYLSSVKERFNEYWKNHFNTIGLVGLNECCLNFLGKDKSIDTPEGHDFAVKVLDFMRDKLIKYQEETSNIYNLEATPAEGTSYRLARKDKKLYPDIICANELDYKESQVSPYYTNSSHLPVDKTDDIFEALKLQDDLQTKYTGGTILHGFIGEKMPSIEATKKLVKRIAENFHLPYFTLTPTFSVCAEHGYISGEHFACPSCGRPSEVYSRVVGYLRPVQQWNEGKQAEYHQRKEYDKQLNVAEKLDEKQIKPEN
jgi:ribonucleoside-triphosphate reductase